MVGTLLSENSSPGKLMCRFAPRRQRRGGSHRRRSAVCPGNPIATTSRVNVRNADAILSAHCIRALLKSRPYRDRYGIADFPS